ncbi:MAG: DUF1343 domain-containing protein [Bacteroidia bacterium]|nr:DUF1343 domain-containing protein [Bacteroidia bacterium]
MSFKVTLYTVLFFVCFVAKSSAQIKPEVRPAAWQTQSYIDLLKTKNIAVVANQTSTIGKTHLVDSLLALGIKITRVFGPEHGFRGNAANGEEVSDTKDKKTGLPITSLYGPRRKPTAEDLKGIDIVVYDLQDVGVRFYTHLTTLHFMMQACAENNVALVVLDRPNPNGYYVDGPIWEKEYKSDVGQHPIPLVHGMTLGELALMIQGENWIQTTQSCKLTVIKIENWDHNTEYVLQTPPSPNLPTQESIIAYPTMGLFEGLKVSVGRGTAHPFECFGAPWLKVGSHKFVPVNIPGKTVNPPFLNDSCRGFLITDFSRNYLVDYRKLYIEWLELLVQQYPYEDKLFNNYFDKLAGTATLRTQIEQKKSLDEIRAGWKPGIDAFLKQRQPYMLYAYNPLVGLLKD